MVGRPFFVALFPMVPMSDVLQQRHIWLQLTFLGVGGLV